MGESLVKLTLVNVTRLVVLMAKLGILNVIVACPETLETASVRGIPTNVADTLAARPAHSLVVPSMRGENTRFTAVISSAAVRLSQSMSRASMVPSQSRL